jgi:pimeloyl-ACP methyl ester carboxylesterase
VIHGQVDPLVPIAAGEDTARHIPGARFEAIAGMAHDLPEPLVPRLVQSIADHIRAVDHTVASRG